MQNLTPAKSLGFLLHDVARLLRRSMDQSAHRLGLTSAQWRVLASVARAEFLQQEPMNQATLADLMDMEPITLSRHIDRMQSAGLIERRPDPGDRRANRLFLTAAARPLVAEFRTVGSQCLSEALDGIDESEIETVIDVLTRMRANIVRRPQSPDLAGPASQSLPEPVVSESSVA